MPIDESTAPDDQQPDADAVDDDAEASLRDDGPDEFDESNAVEFEPDDDLAADDDKALIDRARRRYGTAGAIVAGGMLGLEKVLQPKVKQEAPVEWEAPGEPLDIDRKGITVPIDDEAIVRSRPGPAAAPGAISRKVTRRRRP